MRRFGFITLCTGPAIALLLFLIVAIGWAFYVSFTDFALVGRAARDPQWIGLKNYLRLFRDPFFLHSLDISVKFTVGSAIIGQCLLGLLLAVVLKRKDINTGLKIAVAAAVTLCWVIPDIVVVYIWGAFTAPSGMLNTILGIFGLPSKRWLSEFPLEIVIIANIWRGTAFSMILFSSALETVPPVYYEAADVDGASPWQRFRYITLPLITPTILIDLILITLWTFGYFTLIFGLTGGGPGRATEVMPVFIYNQSFRFYKIGYGAALSFVMMLIVGCMCLIYFLLLRKAERMR
ncbi:TPA: sugar ABC transporter permease [Candidatus Bipolaricaulota bacterium]|nr:sugar ABC transporter permease [Candidatus Bipolaricaulota bacterium]